MLEGLVAWVLNNYLGKYVENLNTDQLSVALLSGKVELENLPLKKDALRHLGLPVEIKAGFIGKVQLQVPVRQIRSVPWLIAIEKLYLVAAPVNLDEWDSNVEALIAHERKVSVLDALEAHWRAEHEANDGGYYATSYSSWLNFGTGLLANIVENLQLKINDVHFRYEDALTCPGQSFACGFTAESLAAESCDANWQRGFTPLSEPCSFKLLELKNLAIYWDPMAVPSGMLAECTIVELTERMSGTWVSTHRWVLRPGGGSARVRRERTEQPLRDRARPRLVCHLTLDAVLLRLTSRQYGEMWGCSRGLERVGRIREARAWRPAAPPRGHARLWWQYALKAHLPHHRWMDPKPTWESCLERARATRQYVDICASTLADPAATLHPDRKRAKDDYEWANSLAVLQPLREVAMRKVPMRSPGGAEGGAGRSVLVRWFPQWWGWYEGSEPAARLESEILHVIADSLEDPALPRRDALSALFEFTLHAGCLDVCADSDDDEGCSGVGLELQFNAVRVRVESRPLSLHASLGAVCVRDRINPRTLFPILVAPQGTIREGLSATNPTTTAAARWGAPRPPDEDKEPLFQLTYERRPLGFNCDHKLRVKSRSVEVVWCASAARWAASWAGAGAGADGAIAHVRDHTRATLLNHYERLLRARRTGERRSWQVELDISAPQLMFVEQLRSRDGGVVLVDFGRLRLANAALAVAAADESPRAQTFDDDEETFMTPCSTPPGSLLSPGSPPDSRAPPSRPLDPEHLHTSLYDRYKIELSDMQILVGRARDNWKYAHTKATSALHLLDRFSISLQAERRVVATSDPQYPTAALCGSLPALVAHLSEHKLAALRAVLAAQADPPPAAHDAHAARATPSFLDGDPEDGDEEKSVSSETEQSEFSSQSNATLLVLQFAVDQLSVEVQSRGRSIAEVQVCGVRLAAGLGPGESSLSLSVHSLLLVDALQTYGPDFELLVASHRHVGMDTTSGSIRGSEPTSPTSPASPETRAPPSAPSPSDLHRALYTLHDTYNGGTSPSSGARAFDWDPRASGNGRGSEGPAWATPGVVDSEALIAVELCIVRGEGASEDLRIANILFNNLDVIANQETIVELIGFAHRVAGATPASAPPPVPPQTRFAPTVGDDLEVGVRTEITFDFHRLGVLLLRAAVREGAVVANKIATATLGDARIQATLHGSLVEASGSLGGVQVVSLSEGAGLHSRILCAGRPPAAPPGPLGPRQPDAQPGEEKALLFTVSRNVRPPNRDELPVVEVSLDVRVASVWYTHSGPLLRELQSCLTEFKQYLANLARSIRAAAADMAIGLVHPRTESLYANPKLSQSTEGVSLRRRTTSLGCSLDEPDRDTQRLVLRVSVSLESPVAVLPRFARSPEVFVAHLGRMSLSNEPGAPGDTMYQVRVRDISLVSLDVSERLKQQAAGGSMQRLYDSEGGKPVLHDTALQLAITLSKDDGKPQCAVAGGVVGGLHVTASREQYEQLLDTVRWIAADAPDRPDGAAADRVRETSTLSEPSVPTLRLDPAVRAAVLAVPPPAAAPSPVASHAPYTVTFELSTFTVELRADLGAGERSLVALTFREFLLRHERLHPHETALQVSLYSITMEDLTKEPDSRHRTLMESHSPPMPPKAVFVSKSCPDFSCHLASNAFALPRLRTERPVRTPSLPSGFSVTDKVTKKEHLRQKQDSKCGPTPPCSPVEGVRGADRRADEAEGERGDDNLVWVSIHTRDPQHPLFDGQFDKVSRLTKVEFNCLKLVLSIDSWVAVLDFFGVNEAERETSKVDDNGKDVGNDAGDKAVAAEAEGGVSETEIRVRSLSVVVVGARGDACRALVSRVAAQVRAHRSPAERHVRASLGALLVSDLAPRAPLWRDRLRTRAESALTLHYHRLSSEGAAATGYDTSLELEMGPLTYVHTRRFVSELQAFARDFSLLRHVIVQARRKVSSVSRDASRFQRMSLKVCCESPVIVVPVSGRSRSALVAELRSLRVDNRFGRAGDPDTVSIVLDPARPERELLDVRGIRLEGVSVWCAGGGTGRGGRMRRCGPPLLPAPTRLVLQMEINCDDTHNVADVTIHGTLTTLQVSLDAAQYQLIRGVLAHNLGEACSELAAVPEPAPKPPRGARRTWSLRLELQNVQVELRRPSAPPLACVHFIRSRLLVDTYSDTSQDVDLVSQEILVSDSRYGSEPANRRGNVFSRIVQPQPDHPHTVQAELHARKRPDSSAYTIMVNNMRLMAILDWWEAAHQFIMQPPPPPADPDHLHFEERSPEFGPELGGNPNAVERATRGIPEQMELKLNVTDSQLVLVEDASVWDTNAVILKSTTVITYRDGDSGRGVVCEVSELEVFSCVLGLEDETALAILDPAALHLALHDDAALHVDMGTVNLRLSYHDMRMFAAMLQSLPAQARLALSDKSEAVVSSDEPANSVHMRAGTLVAPRWLRSRSRSPPAAVEPEPQRPLRSLQVTADCVTLCVIDDCLDSDVPLLELSLADLQLEQDLRGVEESFEDPLLVSTPSSPSSTALVEGRRPAAGGGRLRALLTLDYYNRMLSGWEPVVEPWRFEGRWEYTLSSALSLRRLQVEVSSSEILDTNVTSALIDLARLVRTNWTADYYAPQGSGPADQSPKSSPAGHRRRSPFVPYALRNLTGLRLWFTTLTTASDELREGGDAAPFSGPDDSWVSVRAGDTEPFSFGARRGRARGAPAHGPAGPATLAPLHRLVVRVDGWSPLDPVCVDRVGVFFRLVTHNKSGGEARLVLEVSLEGSARKLVTVRSALCLRNDLPHPVDVRLQHPGPPAHAPGEWGASGSGRSAQVAAGGWWAAPLSERDGVLWTRPLVRSVRPLSPAPLVWRAALSSPALLHYECRAPHDYVYRFCCVIVRERFPAERGEPLAGHTLRLVPSLRVENLLPVELQYRAGSLAGTLAAGVTEPAHRVDVEEGVEVAVKLEGFGWSSALSVGGGADGSFSARLKLRDTKGRRLYLSARVTVKKTDGVKVSISAAYWLVNRTGLPLVFRAEGGGTEAAGQFGEHEVARMVAPLPFAFADGDGPTLSVRLGTAVVANPEWCSPFGLGPGITVKRLEGRGVGGEERAFTVGVNVRAARGRHRRTDVVTFTPRYQIHNNTSRTLQFAQKCSATTLTDPGAAATHVLAVAGCCLPWHWARWDRSPLLCARVLAAATHEPLTAWSGGFKIDSPRSLHVACRESGGSYQIMRAEVVRQGAALLVVVSDAECAPPPLRIDNYSPVAIMYHQVGCAEESVVRSGGRARWALPEPEGERGVALRAPGGPRLTLPLDALHSTHALLYQNFIYVSFAVTAPVDAALPARDAPELVLEVPVGSTRVHLAPKRHGDRSQLWRRGPNGQLIHEGSSPPQPTDARLSDETTVSPHVMVLDIEGAAPRPGLNSALVLRRADGRRASTQAWRLLPDGRMACAHRNLCMQPVGGLMALAPGSRVVLGLSGGREGAAVSGEQRVRWRTLRPGSGRLSVTLAADGPTRLVRIVDTVATEPPPSMESLGEEEREERGEAESAWEWGVTVRLEGVGVSLVSRAELLYAHFAAVRADFGRDRVAFRVALSVHDMQWDNQLPGTPSPVLLYCLPDRNESGAAPLPALHAAVELQRAAPARYNALYFTHLLVALRPIAVRLEERLMLLLWEWLQVSEGAEEEAADEAEWVTPEHAPLHATRYYFALIKLLPSQIRLSMFTANKLEGGAASLKRRLGLTLIRFEDAAVELEPFLRAHAFDTAPALAAQVSQHFKDELKWQAAKILGSVDFLGNPLGFVADVSEGVSGLLLEGNVAALLQNLTHGISNSAAKVTETLGDGLERVVCDEAHEETRRRIRSGAAGSRVAAGLRGLGLGILGGMTSLVKHTYEGATAEGLPGFIAGVGKGIVGTVTKPVIGVLDLAAETAAAVRDSSRRGLRGGRGAGGERVRPPRAPAAALLPRYDAEDARAAATLYALNGRDHSERFLAHRIVRDTPHDIRALLSDSYLRIFTCKGSAPQIVMETHLGNLVSCAAVTAEGAHFVELGVRGAAAEGLRRPRVQCDSRAVARWLARHAAHARQLHHDRTHTLAPLDL
ncbi:unnamed protein product [Pieris brassicae]|uniref:Vacuolar protein sorting-associated protein 13D n=1 Tax=Pieris brassicae TaxID=7116 RepID=A0A9P0SS58_PIEBR|nr:unnamed protein product [Pieris brassicae]